MDIYRTKIEISSPEPSPEKISLHRKVSELALKLVNPGCFSLEPYYEFPTYKFPTETAVCQSGFWLSTYPEDVFSTKTLIVPAGNDKTIVLSEVCKLLDELLQDDTDTFLPHDLRQHLLATQKGFFPVRLTPEVLDFSLPSHGMSCPHDFQDNYFFIGSFLRYVEDNQQAFQFYLETGTFPSEADMQKQRSFERQKLLIELLDLFNEQILPDQPKELKDQTDPHILKIASLSQYDKPVELRGHEVVLGGNILQFLYLTQAVIQSIMADDFNFFPQDVRQKLFTSARIMEDRYKKKGADFPYGMPLKSLCDTMSPDGKYFEHKDGTILVIYTTGFKPVFDFCKNNRKLLEQFRNSDHVFSHIHQKNAGDFSEAVIDAMKSFFNEGINEGRGE